MASDHGAIHVIDSIETWTSKLDEGGLQGKTIVVDFTATWCGPCRLIAPVFEELSKKYSDLLFLKVDVDEFQEIASEWEVRAMPTFLFIKGGKLVDRIVGANKEELMKKVDEISKEGQRRQHTETRAHHHGHHVAHIEA